MVYSVPFLSIYIMGLNCYRTWQHNKNILSVFGKKHDAEPGNLVQTIGLSEAHRHLIKVQFSLIESSENETYFWLYCLPLIIIAALALGYALLAPCKTKCSRDHEATNDYPRLNS